MDFLIQKKWDYMDSLAHFVLIWGKRKSVQYETLVSMYQPIKFGHKEKQHKTTKFIFCCLCIIWCWLRRTERTTRWKKIMAPSIFKRLQIFEAVSSSTHKGIVTIHKDTQAFSCPWLMKVSYSLMSFYWFSSGIVTMGHMMQLSPGKIWHL